MREILVTEELLGELHDAASAYRKELANARRDALDMDRKHLTAKIKKLDALLATSSKTLAQGDESPEPLKTRFFSESDILEVTQDLMSASHRFEVEPWPDGLYRISIAPEHAAILAANGGAASLEEACVLYGITDHDDEEAHVPQQKNRP
jgi:hypothetical protein